MLCDLAARMLFRPLELNIGVVTSFIGAIAFIIVFTGPERRQQMLEVNALSVSYGELDILKDVSFTVDTREWLMIAGPNGAGKSTIINAITGGAPYKGNISLTA